MSDIFEEINEELKQDQVFQVWKRYSRLIIAVLVLLVVVMGAWLAWTNYRTSQAQGLGDKLSSAVEAREAGDSDAAAATLGELVENGGSYGLIAAFQLADLEAARGDKDAAIVALDSVRSGKAPERYKELATLLASMHRLDGGDASALTADLEGLTGGKGTFANNARELLAVVAVREGDLDAARTQLQGLIDDTEVTGGVKNRARELLGTLPAAE